MTHSSHGSGRHHRSPIRRFFDTLLGRRSRGSGHQHSSRYPGISYERLNEEPDKPQPATSQPGEFKPPQPPARDDFRARKNASLKERINLYFKRRAFKKEERTKNRLRRRHRRENQESYRKAESGRTLAEKLLTIKEITEAEKEMMKSRARRSSLYHNAAYLVNSTAIFILTYILVYLIYWLTEMFMASLYGLDSILYYYDLKFNDYSSLWSRFNILVITGIPPIISLSVGLILHRVVFKNKRFNSLQKLFILWWSLHSISHFFGAFAAGVVTDEGFGYVAAWMYMNTAFKFMFSLISLFMLGVVGYFSKQLFLETSNSVNRIKSENQIAFIFTQALIPWFLGTALILLTRIPKNFDYPYETFILLSMAFAVIPAFFKESVQPKLNLLKLKKKTRIHFGYIIMLLAFLAFYRIMLGIGLHFIIKISISISPAIN